MSASPIIGHALQRAQLQQDVETGNLAHAYLFSGPPHLGKALIAKWFGTEILKSVTPPAAHAEVERRTEKLLHPDLLVLDRLWIEERCEDFDEIAKSSNVSQVHRSKAPTIMRTDTIGIEDVRLLQERLQETGELTRRVCIVTSVERMRDEAANAFLKTLEEPPPGRVFILTTEALSSLLPTVVSRSRILHFSPLPVADLRPLLAGQTDDDANFLLHVSQGRPGMVRRLLSDPELLRNEKTVHQQAASFWSSRKPGERMKLLAPVHERGEDADRFLLHLSLTLREQAARSPASVAALMALLRGLETNANRAILAERLALSV